VSPAGALQRRGTRPGHPQDNQRAMVAVLRFFSRALHVVPLAYPAAPSRLELFKPLDATVERSYHPSTFNFG
jgi:hypothetical protein